MTSTSRRIPRGLATVAFLLGTAVALLSGANGLADDAGLRVGVFCVDASPPIGSPVAYVSARSIEDPMSARGIVLLGAGEPIVLCVVDCIGISNGGYETSSGASNVAPETERILLDAIKRLLQLQ